MKSAVSQHVHAVLSYIMWQVDVSMCFDVANMACVLTVVCVHCTQHWYGRVSGPPMPTVARLFSSPVVSLCLMKDVKLYEFVGQFAQWFQPECRKLRVAHGRGTQKGTK